MTRLRSFCAQAWSRLKSRRPRTRRQLDRWMAGCRTTPGTSACGARTSTRTSPSGCPNFRPRAGAPPPTSASAAGLARQMVTRDPDDTQRRSDLAIALRRSALVPAMEGKIGESNRLRGEATAELRKSAFQVPAPATQVEQAVPACPSMDEQFSEGTSLTPLKAGDLLIANRSSGSGAGTLLVFSPESHEMSVLATGRYLSDMADVAFSSRTELYVAGRSLTRSRGIGRPRDEAGHRRRPDRRRSGKWLADAARADRHLDRAGQNRSFRRGRLLPFAVLGRRGRAG